MGIGSLEWKKGPERIIREQRKARIRDRKVRMAGKEYLGGKKGRKARPEGKNGRKGISGRKERAEEEGLECRKAWLEPWP